MADAPAKSGEMTLDAFMLRYEQHGAFEIVDGDALRVSPNVAGHNMIVKRLFIALLPYETQSVGEAFTETPFVLMDTLQWVSGSRVPDLMFYSASRLDEYHILHPDWREKPFVLVPDFVVEVLSKNNTHHKCST